MTGIIIREWFAIDQGGLVDSCTQTITVENNAPLIFTFPGNDTLTCNGIYNPEESGKPTVVGSCRNIVEVVIDSVRLNDNCNGKLFINWGFYDNCADSFLLDTATQIIYFLD